MCSRCVCSCPEPLHYPHFPPPPQRRRNAAAPPMPTRCRRRMYVQSVAGDALPLPSPATMAAALVLSSRWVRPCIYVCILLLTAADATAAWRGRRVRRGVDGGAAGGKYISSSSRHLTCDTKGAHSCLLLLCFSSSLCHICPTVSRKAAHDVRSLPLCI